MPDINQHSDAVVQALLGVIQAINNLSQTITGLPLSAMIDEQFGDTEGMILYRGAAGWEALAPGTSGQVLTMNAGGDAPEWV